MGGDEHLCFAILNDVSNFLFLEPVADGRVVEPSALRRPAQGEEGGVVLHHDGDVVPHRQTQASEQLRSLIRAGFEVSVGDRLPRGGKNIGGFVGVLSGVYSRMHGASFSNGPRCPRGH